MKVPEYFKDSELACKCGCGLLPNFEFVRKFYIFRMLVNEPVIVISGARCPAHNADEGGAEDSAHIIGAADIEITKEKEYHYVWAAQVAGFDGIGIHDNVMMHLDDKHMTPAIWTY